MSEAVARQQDLANFVTVRKRMSVGDCSDGVSVAAATKLFVTRRGELTPQDLTHDAHHLIVTFAFAVL